MKSIESIESSSPVVTRAVAAGLRREFSDNLEFPFWQENFAHRLGGIATRRGTVCHQSLSIHFWIASQDIWMDSLSKNFCSHALMTMRN